MIARLETIRDGFLLACGFWLFEHAVMPTSSFFWWYWRGLIVLGFGVPEAWAIFHRQPWNTFSNQWWTWIAVFAPRHPILNYLSLAENCHLRQIAFAPFLLYLDAHFEFGAQGNPWLWLAALPALGVALYSSIKGER